MYTHIDLRSVWDGILAMRRHAEPVNFGVDRTPPGASRWWFIAWTPIWHRGRGPYLSIGLGLFVIYRGY